MEDDPTLIAFHSVCQRRGEPSVLSIVNVKAKLLRTWVGESQGPSSRHSSKYSCQDLKVCVRINGNRVGKIQ